MVEEGGHNNGVATSSTATTPGSTTATRDTIEMNPVAIKLKNQTKHYSEETGSGGGGGGQSIQTQRLS